MFLRQLSGIRSTSCPFLSHWGLTGVTLLT
jgi:hypothetical protein